MHESRRTGLAWMASRSLFLKGSAGGKLRCKVSEFCFVLFYQPSMVFVIKLVKMEKQKQNETVSGFALAASRFFFKASKHVFKNSLNNCAYVFNCDELSWFCDSGKNLSRKYSSLPGGWLRWSKLLFLMSFCKTGQTFFFPFAKIIENCS